MIYLECIPKIFSFVPKTKDLTAYDRPNLDKIHNGTDVARQSDYRVRCTPSRQNTMVKEMLHGRDDVLWLNGDEPDVRNLFDGATSTLLKSIIGKQKISCNRRGTTHIRHRHIHQVDCRQHSRHSGHSHGSSSFDLSNKINEPLTGRKFEYCMYPLSFAEMVANTGLIEEKRMLQQRLVYGYYPDVVCNAGDERAILSELSNSYLYKDILLLDKIKKSEKLIKLLQALAFQVGSEVSFNELSQICGLDPKTIDTYVSLLEQSYIVFRLGSFSRNLRNELKFSRKIYFWDCGIRNAIISNYKSIDSRTDAGALFENFVISERMKKIQYEKTYAKGYFWRTTAKSEIDYVEETDGKLSAFEFKWNPKRKASIPLTFSRAYPGTDFNAVTRDNCESFLL